MSVSFNTQRVGLQNVWSTDEGNYHATYRSNSPRRLVYQIKQYVPPPQTTTHELDEDVGSVILYILPGVRCSSKTKQLFWKLADFKTPYPQRAEIEFSAVGLGTPSTPKAYKTSTVDWALSVCSEILICVDRSPGSQVGEAHRVLAPLQCVFRCLEEDVPEWTEFLSPRLRGRSRLSVVHLAAGRA